MDHKPQILTGAPAGTKAVGSGSRADIELSRFDLLVVTRGYRVWWSRTAPCPCRSNAVSKQPDPTCTLCKGRGRFQFLPVPGMTAEDRDIAGNPIEVSDDGTGVGISVTMVSATMDPQIYERFGEWLLGTARVTAQSANRLGYYDRLIARDAMIWCGQTIEADGTNLIHVTGRQSEAGLWAPTAKINLLRSLTEEYVEKTDFEITTDGEIHWLTTPPVAGTVLSYHGAFHPRWIVLGFPFAVRDTMVEFKKSSKTLAEQWTQLPINAMVKLEFLVEP